MGIEINKSDDNKTLQLVISGRFDFSLHKNFRDAYKSEPADMNYVIDMHNTDYMDSSALGMLLLLREHAGNDASRISITGCQPTIKQILAISNFEKLFNIS